MTTTTTPNYRIHGGRLYVQVPRQVRHLAADLPGARFDAGLGCWHLPATPAAWEAFTGRFPNAGDSENELAEALAERRRAHGNVGSYAGTEPCYEHHLRPWAHQHEATMFAGTMDACLLHCWMGTGKTKIALDTANLRGHRTVLVVCPCSVIDVWRLEAEKHAPGKWRVLTLQGESVAKRAQRLRAALDFSERTGRPLLVAVNYEVTWREPLAKALRAHEWGMLVFDESHRIKAPGSKQSRAAARIPAAHRLALTGTPMPHSPLDLYGQYRALDPGIFGTSYTKFRDRYAVLGGPDRNWVTGFTNQDELRANMDRICYHVSSDVLELPEMQVIDRECDLEKEAARVYHELENEFIAELDEGVVTAANAVVKLLRLQQVAAGAVTNEAGDLVTVSKAKRSLLAEMLEDIGPEPVVVFCRFTHDLQTVRAVAQKLGRRYGEISGNEKDYLAWKAGNVDVLGVQVQAGGEGLDLTEARYALYFTRGFSLGNYQQTLARIHRPGQERPVTVYRLLAQNAGRATVDQRIARTLAHREAQIARVLDADRECLDELLNSYKEGRDA